MCKKFAVWSIENVSSLVALQNLYFNWTALLSCFVFGLGSIVLLFTFSPTNPVRSSESCKVAVLRKSRKGYPCWTSFQEWGNIFLKNHVQTLIGPFLVNQGVVYFHPKPYPAILPSPLSPDPSLEIREGGGWWSSRPLDKGRGGSLPPKICFGSSGLILVQK